MKDMDTVKIGRSSDNDEIITQGEVSRHHCELFCKNNKVFIKDLGSLNGTKVNGEKITEPIWLKKCDKVTLGQNVVIDWYSIWTKHYNYTSVFDNISDRKTIRNNEYVEPKPQPQRPFVDIPSSIHIKEDHADVYKSGDDFKVPFKRNLGSNIGHHVGNTLGCVISVIIVVTILAIIGLIMS